MADISIKTWLLLVNKACFKTLLCTYAHYMSSSTTPQLLNLLRSDLSMGERPVFGKLAVLNVVLSMEYVIVMLNSSLWILRLLVIAVS